MATPGEQPTLSIAKQLPTLLAEWTGGLPPFQLQRTVNLENIVWENDGNVTLARSAVIEGKGPSGFYRLQSQVPQLNVDLSGPATRLFWDVPETAGSSQPVPDIYPWPFPGVKPEGWVEWVVNQNHAATWDYQEQPIPGHQSIGFHSPAQGTASPVSPFAVGAFYHFSEPHDELYMSFLFKALVAPYRAVEICDLYDVNELCNIYLYPEGGQYGGGIGLFMREGYGGVTSPIPINETIRIWFHFKKTDTGCVSDVAWALPNEPRPTSGPQLVDTGNTTLKGDIVKFLFGPVAEGSTMVYADLKIASFPMDSAPGVPDQIDHFQLRRRVPEGEWSILADPIAPEARDYVDNDVPNPSFDYTLRGFTTQGQEWDYTPIIRVEETPHGVFKWNNKISSTSPSGDNEARSVVVHSSGVAIAGYFAANADFGGGIVPSAGSYDGFVAKYSPDGDYLWGRGIGGTDNDQIRAVAFDSTGAVYAHGYFQSPNMFFGPGFGPYTPKTSDCFLLKLNGATGETEWVNVIENPGIDQAFGLTIDALDHVVICGMFFVPFQDVSCFVARFSHTGQRLWLKSFGSSDTDHASCVAIDKSSNSIIVTGQFKGSMTIDGVTLTSIGADDAFLIKLNPDGSLVWAKSFGGPSIDAGYGVAVATNGDIALVGNFIGSIDFGNGITLTGHGNSDMYLAYFNSAGVCQWAKNWGTQFGGDTLQKVAFSPDGNIVMTGWISGFIDMGGGFLPALGGQDVLLAKFNPGGQYIWARRYGGFGLDYGRSVAVSDTGDIHATGAFNSSIDFGGGPLTSGGQLLTSFVVKLGP